MKRNNHNPISWLLASSLLIGSAAWAAQPVTVNNPSFEDSASGTPVGWTNVNGGASVFTPTTAQYNPLTKVPDGSNVASIFQRVAGDGISQVLAANLQADASYTLTVKVGDPADSTFDGYTIQLLANGTLLGQDDNTQTPANGDFATATATYVYNAGDAALVGQPLEIRLLGKGLSLSNGDVNFDDVQLTATLGNPIAEPGGPYSVFIGSSLLLDGSGSLPSNGETITTYEWDLNINDNGGVFNADVTGVTPAAITEATLTSTYGMSLGSNTIKLRVTDSAAKTSIVEGTVNILPPTAVVYEPFAYAGTILNGSSGTWETGLDGAWTANNASAMGDDLAYGALVTRGGGIGNFGAGGNTFGGGRPVNASALAANGLLNDGATLWFSVILGYDSGGNRTNTRLTMVLGDESMSTGNFSYWFPTPGSTGLGVTMGRFGDNGKIVATQVRDQSFGNGQANPGVTGNVFDPNANSTPAVYPGANTNRDIKLVVGRITWGATDTIDIFLPDENLQVDLNTPHSSLTVTVDQSGYDTISFQRGDRVVWDEIRFGASYESVTETGSYWDLNGATAGSGSTTPSGTWNTDPNWNEAIDGTAATAAWAAGDNAVFSAGDDATGAYTVTVDGTQDIAGIIAEDGTVTVSGGTGLRMVSNGAITTKSNLSSTISTPFLQDAPGRILGKSGTGITIFAADNSGVTGGMLLSAGAAQFESPLAIAGTARDVAIGTSGAIAFGPGFGAGNIPAALADRIVATTPGTIAVNHQTTTDFDFNTPGLTGAYLGAIGNVTYTGTLTPNGTTYRLGNGGGTLTMGNTNALTGANALLVRGSVVLGADNDYTGATTIPGDSSLRIMGATGTSGISVSQPAGLLEIGANGALGAGTLTLNGGFGVSVTLSAVGDSANTNAVAANGNFILAGTGTLSLGTMTINGNRIIDNNNTTGTTTLAAVTASGGARTLAFSGNGNTTVAGAIGGGTNVSNLTKNGNGTLTLNGVNTHTGTTTVNNAGTLLVVSPGSLPAGAVTLNATSTLAGDGSIGGNVTVTAAAKIAPGNSGVGTLPITGNLTITAMAGGAGTLNYDLGPIAASDKITVGGSLAIGAGTFGFTDFVFTNVGGLQNGTYKLITSGAAVNGTLNGSDLTGSLGGDASGTLQISDGGTGNDIELVVTGVPGGSPYETWASGGELFGDDANGDGVKNGLAFLLGAANPDVNALGLLPVVDEDSGGLVLTFSMLNAANRGAASLSVQWSNDLGITDPWTTNTALVPETSSTVNDVVFVITPNGTTNGVVATIPATKADVGKLFGRLSANE